MTSWNTSKIHQPILANMKSMQILEQRNRLPEDEDNNETQRAKLN